MSNTNANTATTSVATNRGSSIRHENGQRESEVSRGWDLLREGPLFSQFPLVLTTWGVNFDSDTSKVDHPAGRIVKGTIGKTHITGTWRGGGGGASKIDLGLSMICKLPNFNAFK